MTKRRKVAVGLSIVGAVVGFLGIILFWLAHYNAGTEITVAGMIILIAALATEEDA